MAWTENDLGALNEAIKSGTLSVQYGDRVVRYQTMDALIRARNLILGEMSAAAGKPVRKRTFRAYQSGSGLT